MYIHYKRLVNEHMPKSLLLLLFVMFCTDSNLFPLCRGSGKTRNINIFALEGAGARQLPKFDWPERLVYQHIG